MKDKQEIINRALKVPAKAVALALIASSTSACSSIISQDWGSENGRVLVYGDAEGVGALFDGINGGNLVAKMPAEDTTRDNPYAELRRTQDITRRMKYFVANPVHKQKQQPRRAK